MPATVARWGLGKRLVDAWIDFWMRVASAERILSGIYSRASAVRAVQPLEDLATTDGGPGAPASTARTRPRSRGTKKSRETSRATRPRADKYQAYIAILISPHATYFGMSLGLSCTLMAIGLAIRALMDTETTVLDMPPFTGDRP